MRLLIGAAMVAGLVTGASAQVDPTALVRQSIKNYERNWQESANWRYLQSDVSKGDGTDGADISEIFPLEGTPYERLVMHDSHALSADEQRKEEHKFQKALKERQRETPEERRTRIRKYETEREFVREIPEAYTFHLVGEEMVRGRAAWVISMTPKPGFVPTMPHGSMLEHIEGTLWLDKEDLQWARAEARVKSTIGIGFVLARIGPGAKIVVEQTRVAEGVWMPQQITINGAARVLLVHNKIMNEELTYSKYQRAPGGTVSASTQASNIPKGPEVSQSFR
jgi:hypothetical protein